MNDAIPPLNASPTQEERNWAVAAHLSGFVAFVVPVIGGILGPLVVWLLKKEQLPFIEDQGKEALNFQLTIFICGVVSFLLVFVAIGVVLLIALYVFNIVIVIIAAVKASEGVRFRYPVNFRLIR